MISSLHKVVEAVLPLCVEFDEFPFDFYLPFFAQVVHRSLQSHDLDLYSRLPSCLQDLFFFSCLLSLYHRQNFVLQVTHSLHYLLLLSLLFTKTYILLLSKSGIMRSVAISGRVRYRNVGSLLRRRVSVRGILKMLRGALWSNVLSPCGCDGGDISILCDVPTLFLSSIGTISSGIEGELVGALTIH